LLYHGWSEQPLDAASTAWADPITGLSDNFWGRALGWYIMGLVDVLDYFPPDHEKYADMIAILNRWHLR
jgi:unsaturated rhamnogalacturonyl hydrolase